MLPKFLWKYEWARRKYGGKWEKWTEWKPVQEWSTPSTHPDEYGTGNLPMREDHGVRASTKSG